MFTEEENEKISILAEENHQTRTSMIAILVKFGLKYVEKECGPIDTAKFRSLISE